MIRKYCITFNYRIFIIMTSGKKKLEVFFKSQFQVDNTSDLAIKSCLEQFIFGLKVTKVETTTTKSIVKAIVSSNIMDLIREKEENEIADYRKTKSISLVGGYSDFASSPEAIEEKDKEIADLGFKLSKIKKELEDEKLKNEKLMKEGGGTNDLKEMSAMYMTEIQNLTEQLITVDNEKNIIDEKNKELTRQIEIMSLKRVPKISPIKKEDLKPDENYGKLLKEFTSLKEEKEILTLSLKKASSKIIEDEKKINELTSKSNKFENLEESIQTLENENNRLKENLNEKTIDMEYKQKEYIELENAINKLKNNIEKN